MTDEKGVGGTLTWGWSVDFQDALKVSGDVWSSAPTVGNRCGWVEKLCFRGTCLKFGTSRHLPERPRPRHRRWALLGFQLGRGRAGALKPVPFPPSPLPTFSKFQRFARPVFSGL